MTNNVTNKNQQTRSIWLSVLARASKPELEAALSPLGKLPALQHVRPPEAGMAMLRGRIGGTGDAFNAGEATVTRCALRLGSGPLGVGYVLGRDRRKAELVAVFDALMQDPAHAENVQRGVVNIMAARQDSGRAAVQHAVAASKVDFFTFVRGEA